MNQRTATSRLFSGLQAGMAGALLMLAWLAVATLWSRHSVWWFPNLMGTTFGGDAALKIGFGKYSLPGLALHLIQFSLLGACFGRFVPERTPYSRLLLAGVLVGLAYYYAMYGFMWNHLNPLIPLYSPDRQVLVGHVFYGLMLARIDRYRTASELVIE